MWNIPSKIVLWNNSNNFGLPVNSNNWIIHKLNLKSSSMYLTALSYGNIFRWQKLLLCFISIWCPYIVLLLFCHLENILHIFLWIAHYTISELHFTWRKTFEIIDSLNHFLIFRNFLLKGLLFIALFINISTLPLSGFYLLQFQRSQSMINLGEKTKPFVLGFLFVILMEKCFWTIVSSARKNSSWKSCKRTLVFGLVTIHCASQCDCIRINSSWL